MGRGTSQAKTSKAVPDLGTIQTHRAVGKHGIWAEAEACSRTAWVTLSRLLNLAEPQSPYL